MAFRKVTAIISRNTMANVEAALQQIGVNGLSVSAIKGFGEYADFFERDWMTAHFRVEVFTSTANAETIARTIIDAAHTGQAGDGLVAIVPVENLYRIRTREVAAIQPLISHP
jgi:nitrogen regulatory protein P-II 1